MKKAFVSTRWVRFVLLALTLALVLFTGLADVRASGPDSSTNQPPLPPQLGKTPPYGKAPSGVNVGYYEMSSGSGQAYMLPPITSAGQTGISLPAVGAANLAGLQVLDVMNSSNSSTYASGYTGNLAAIQNAVNGGLVLIVHDRAVNSTTTKTTLPGGSGISFVRSENANIDLLDTSTVLTAGLNNSSLDGGNWSNHGYAVKSSLPANARMYMDDRDPTHIVTFSYPFGAGCVIYSTIPLDYYLQGNGNNPPRDTFKFTYAPNSIRFAASGAGGCAAALSLPAEVPEADTLLLFAGGVGGLATWLGWQRRRVRAKSK